MLLLGNTVGYLAVSILLGAAPVKYRNTRCTNATKQQDFMRRLPDTLRPVTRGTSPSSYRVVSKRKGMVTTNPLFKFGVDIEGVDADGKTALHRAAMFPDQDKARQRQLHFVS